MSKSVRRQVADALWYLDKPDFNNTDGDKAKRILYDIAFGKRKSRSKQLEISSYAIPPKQKNQDTVGIKKLAGQQVTVIPGHVPGGGAIGERVYNIKVAKIMIRVLKSWGVDTFYYEHKLKSYTQRQIAMADFVRTIHPKSFIVTELHYDSYKNKEVSGHHFQYLGAKQLALATQKEFLKRYPQSKARYSNGIYKNEKGNGHGFLKLAPGWAQLNEPFFRSNKNEWEFFKDKHEELAMINCLGMAEFARLKL